MEPNEPTTDQRRVSLGNSAVWMRGLYMLLLLLAFWVAHGLLCVAAVAQFYASLNGMSLPAKKASMLSSASYPIWLRASIAAEPRCGNRNVLGRS